jgi:UrcA family protein
MTGRAGSTGPKRDATMIKILPAILLAFASTPAIAEPNQSVSSIVTIADLNLSQADGRRTLDRRLAQAIAEVCGEASPADLAGLNDVRDCRVETRARLQAERDLRIAEASSRPILVASR